MNLGLGNTLLPGDPRLIDHIVGEVKSQGIFDQFRKDALADVDTKPAYQNLRTRVESSVNSFLAKQTWKADLNKNQLRETLRKHISVASYLDTGVERIVDQVVNPKIYSVFMPQIEDVVYEYLGLEKPKREENGLCGLKDLLPIDLDPVSPESDKNSLKDVSLDSVDANMTMSESKQTKEAVSTLEETRDDGMETDKANNSNEERKSPSNALVDGNDSVEKVDEEDEDDEDESPSFEPIDIMNLHESNISNDSHLSGISELTSHRSCSPACNEFQDNFDFSNHDSQFSKVSSNSHLSIVTDFGSSNQAFTSISDTSKDENSKSKSLKNNFQAIRDVGEDNKTLKVENIEINDVNNAKNPKESSRDSLSSRKDTDNKEKDKNRDLSKLKSGKDSDSRSSKNSRDRDSKRKSSSSDSKNDSALKSKTRDKSTSSSDGKSKEITKDSGKKTKDLKDIYKEKIRELREKKELTEKEKLMKDPAKDSKHKKSSSKDKKETRHSSSKSSSSSADNHSSKLKTESTGKISKNSRDISKTDEGKKEKKERSHSSSDRKTSKSDSKSSSTVSSSTKRESRSDSHTRSSEKSKRESDSKDKKRREEKKSKSKDDHSSLRKNSNDRRSSDRDGSNGSNGKGDNSSPSTPTAKSGLSRESSSAIGNSSSEVPHGVDESKTKECTDPSAEGNEEVKTPEEPKEISLPLKKRPLNNQEDSGTQSCVKKPKFARNFEEAKKMVKLRKKLEKQKQVEDKERTESPLLIVPDNKRVQIIEFPVDSDDELNADGDGYQKQAILILEPDEMDALSSNKSKLSEMELAIRESLNNMMTGENLEEGLNKENVCVLNLQNEDELEKTDTTSIGMKETISLLDDDEDCRFFVADNERLLRFNKFLQKLEIEEYNFDHLDQSDACKELKTMAPPQLKRKYSVSPLSDILISSNNNDSHPIEANLSEEEKLMKSKRMRRSKKSGPGVSSSSPQKITNGEHFVMPLSPESDVSVTSDKTTSLNRDDKSRARSSQHYTSDDLYKPRPLFVGSSRRNRRSHQA